MVAQYERLGLRADAIRAPKALTDVGSVIYGRHVARVIGQDGHFSDKKDRAGDRLPQSQPRPTPWDAKMVARRA